VAVNVELIKELAASNADNAIEDITLAVRALGLKYAWSIEEMMDVGALVCEQRRKTLETTIETVTLGLKGALEKL